MKGDHTKTIYNLMLGSMFLRFFWLVFFEPRGFKRAIENNPDNFIVHTIPFVVYPSIAILLTIIIFSFFRKKWAYMAGIVFGITHLVLIIPLVVLGLNPGFGPLIVIPVCMLMILFSALMYKHNA